MKGIAQIESQVYILFELIDFWDISHCAYGKRVQLTGLVPEFRLASFHNN